MTSRPTAFSAVSWTNCWRSLPPAAERLSFRPFLFDQHPPKNLARRRLWNRVDELELADLFVRRNALGDEVHDVLGRRRRLRDDERLGHLAGLFIGDRKSTRLNSSHEWISYAV